MFSIHSAGSGCKETSKFRISFYNSITTLCFFKVVTPTFLQDAKKWNFKFNWGALFSKNIFNEHETARIREEIQSQIAKGKHKVDLDVSDFDGDITHQELKDIRKTALKELKAETKDDAFSKFKNFFKIP